jgi:hypothetical protein
MRIFSGKPAKCGLAVYSAAAPFPFPRRSPFGGLIGNQSTKNTSSRPSDDPEIPSKPSIRLYNFVKIVIFPFSFRLIDLY